LLFGCSISGADVLADLGLEPQWMKVCLLGGQKKAGRQGSSLGERTATVADL